MSISAAEKRARAAEKVHKKALATSTWAGDAAQVDVESTRAEAQRLRSEADEAARLDKVAKDIGIPDKAETTAPADTPAPTAKPGTKRRARSQSRESKKVTDAARYATIGAPAAATAGALRSWGDVFWTFAGSLVGALLVYMLVTNASKTSKLTSTLGDAALSAIYPAAVFGDTKSKAKKPSTEKTK